MGCGRGEFLDLLASRGIRARGIDVNPEMVEACQARGLDATVGDVGQLSLDARRRVARRPLLGAGGGAPSAGLSAAIPRARVPQDRLPGGRLVLETINPACWVAFFDSYIRDITHVWPLHPETLKYLVMASGFPTARSSSARRCPRATGCSLDPRCRRGPAASGHRGDLQRQHGQTERTDFQLPGLCRGRHPLSAWSRSGRSPSHPACVTSGHEPAMRRCPSRIPRHAVL